MSDTLALAAPPAGAARAAAGGLRIVDRGNLRTLLVFAACLVGRPGAASLLAGGMLLAGGGGLHLWAKGCLRQNRSLAMSGPYRFSRNPFYLANLLIDLGIAIAAAQPWLVAALLPLWLGVYRSTVRKEEAVLESLFGEHFRRYARRVPRFLSARRPIPAEGPGFSWRNRNLVVGREYPRLLRLAALPALLWLAAALRERMVAGRWDDPGPEIGIAVALLGSKLLERALAARLAGRRWLLTDRRTGWPLTVFWTGTLLLMLAVGRVAQDGLGPGTIATTLLLLCGGAIAAWALSAGSDCVDRVVTGVAWGCAGWLVGLPWIGLLGAIGFFLLAIDALALPPAEPEIPAADPAQPVGEIDPRGPGVGGVAAQWPRRRAVRPRTGRVHASRSASC